MAQATAAWQVAKPRLLINDSDFVEVTQAGDIAIGRRLIAKMRESDRGPALADFVMLHELRHVYQRSDASGREKVALECDSDFFASYQLGKSQMESGVAGSESQTLRKALELQGIAVSAGQLGGPAPGHKHLALSQRFSVGAFGTWRAIDEWIEGSGARAAGLFGRLHLRAHTFIEPEGDGLERWVTRFCDALLARLTKQIPLTFRMKDSRIIGAPGPDPHFENTWEIENDDDRTLRVHGWALSGVRPENGSAAYARYKAWSAEYFTASIPPRGTALVTATQYAPLEEPDGYEPFRWGDPSRMEFIVAIEPESSSVATRSDNRAGSSAGVMSTRASDKPNCASAWRNPADAAMAELFGFLFRAGGIAGRGFEGMKGAPQTSVLGASWFYEWTSLPKVAISAHSFISLVPGKAPEAAITILSSESLREAETVYRRQGEIARQGCASTGASLVERTNADGTKVLTVTRWSLLSVAELKLRKTKEDDGDRSERAQYLVTWELHLAEDPRRPADRVTTTPAAPAAQ